ncbi:MAG: EAL domain-containing protein [Pseudomonadales bacterium]|nr:EAL domain-containing protein [Pseudomonadales bacterium]
MSDNNGIDPRSVPEVTLTDYLTHWTFLVTVLVSASVWIWDPLLAEWLLADGALQANNFAYVFHHTLLSLFILSLGSIASYVYIRWHAEKRALVEKEYMLSRIIESEPECVKTVSPDGYLMSMNPAGLAMVGASSFEEISNTEVVGLIAPEYKKAFWNFHKKIIDGYSEKIEFDIVSLQGERKTVESHAVPLRNANGEVTAHLSVTRDITSTKQLNNELRRQASHDSLTGLVNRHEFELRLSVSIERAKKDNSMHAVFFLDLDQFKVVNDTCGHFAGDHLLKQVAQLLRENFRKQDTIARLGGDEFALLLECCSEEDALTHARMLREKIEAMDFYWESKLFKLTASVGAVMVDESMNTVTQVLLSADTACYAAKDRGRNRVFLLKPDEEEVKRERGQMDWVARIHEGIRSKRFLLYAQMIESLDGSSKAHAEILLRYEDVDCNIVPPGAFLPAAERYDIISKLDRYVVENTLHQLVDAPKMFKKISRVSINLSGQSVADETFLAFIFEQFERWPDLAQRICFEITETAAMHDISVAKKFIDQIRALGCEFSLDDFGSGLSSFAYLKNLPVDFVKIDGEFVRDIANDATHYAMIRSINDIAHLMQKRTVAEFVEDDEIKSMLQQLGVDYAQGYGVHKPQPLSELQAWLVDAPENKAS